jgi:hypothetical protein
MALALPAVDSSSTLNLNHTKLPATKKKTAIWVIFPKNRQLVDILGHMVLLET